MKDIPIFTSTEGIATLILHEIPYRKEGYVLIRGVFGDFERLLSDCEGFCRAVGAERVYFGGEGDFSGRPVHARLIERRLDCAALPPTAAEAVPAAADAAGDWLALYRARFAAVPAAQSCPDTEDLYFITLEGARIGLGQIRSGMLRSVAALAPGRGADCVCALAAADGATELRLLCAMENLPAMRLYDRLGFSRGEIKEVWYGAK